GGSRRRCYASQGARAIRLSIGNAGLLPRLMSDDKRRFDIFICGGSQHVAMLQPLLAKLQPFGTIHLASSFLTEDDLRQLHGRFDVLHTPRHSPDGYSNFELFSIRDINRLAAAPYFV